MIETTTRGHVLEITLNRPEAMNALSPEMTRDLTDALVAFDKDGSLRVALITGAGERAFCAGADLGRMQQTLEAQPAATTPRAESPGGPTLSPTRFHHAQDLLSGNRPDRRGDVRHLSVRCP